MPTEVSLATEQRGAVEKRKSADLLAFLILKPLIMCLVSSL